MSAISVHTLKQALAIAEQIQDLETKLAGILGQAPGVSKSVAAIVAASAPVAARRKKYTMTASHKAAIVKAQKARWTKGKTAKPAPKAKKPKAKSRKKGKMSAAGRANIVKAQKARWAKIKAGKGKKV